MHFNSPPRFHLTRVAALAMVAAAASIPHSARAGGASEVLFTVGPFTETRTPTAVSGPQAVTLKLEPEGGYKIVKSDVTMHDGILWERQGEHSFRAAVVYSSKEFVHVDGKVVKIETGSGEGSGEPDPFHVTIPAVDLDWGNKGHDGNAITEDTEDRNFVWINDQTNGNFVINAPLEGRDDMYLWTEGFDKYPDMLLSWDAGKIDVIADEKVIDAGSLFIPRTTWGGGHGPKAPTKFKVSRNINSTQYGEEVEITLTRMGNGKSGGVNTSSNNNVAGANVSAAATSAASGNAYDVIKAKTYSVKLKSVEFGGVGYEDVRKDDDTADFPKPHWEDKSPIPDGDVEDAVDNCSPVCFIRDTKMMLNVKWNALGLDDGTPVKVEGSGPDNIVFPKTDAVVSAGLIEIDGYLSKNPLPNTVKFYEPMSIAWNVDTGSGPAADGGTSTNTVYVTLGKPLTTVFHTIVHLGCKKANDFSIPDQVVDIMYTEFTDRSVTRMDGVQMTYWKNWRIPSTPYARSTVGILSNTSTNGNCEAWSALFKDFIKVQGLPAERIKALPFMHDDKGIMVKKWMFGSSKSSPDTKYPYVIDVDVTFFECTPGQGNDDTPREFNGHWITEYEKTYYDPSYGTKKISGDNRKKAYEDSTIDGFYNGNYARENDRSIPSVSELEYTVN